MTYERPEWESLQVKKRDGTTESFGRQKLRAGVERAVEKRDVTQTTVAALVDDIETELQAREVGIVSSSLIGELVSENLRTLDKMAYIRFVPVYKTFSELEKLLRELGVVFDTELDEFEASNDSL